MSLVVDLVVLHRLFAFASNRVRVALSAGALVPRPSHHCWKRCICTGPLPPLVQAGAAGTGWPVLNVYPLEKIHPDKCVCAEV